MSDLPVEIIGLEDWEAELRRLTTEMRGEVLENALRAGALRIEGPAKEKAPVLTGNLRRSIHTETSSGGEGAEAKIGTDVIYAAIQEFGGTIVPKTKPYLVFQTKDGAWHRTESVTIPAHPYLRPAFDENKDQAVREVGRAIEAQLRKVVE